MTTPTPRTAMTSDDIRPGAFSEDDLRQAWNQQADEHNQWDSLGFDEQLAWAQVQAIDADHAALKAEPEGKQPTEQDLYDLAAEFDGDPVPAMRRALEVWGNPLQGAPAPGENPATPPAPEPGEVAKWHPLWYLVEFLEGHSSFRRQTEPTDELAQILSDSATLLQQQDAELATLKDDGWAKAMTNLVDQIGGDGPSLWEWGASIPTPKKVVEYLREHIDYLEYLGRAQGALTALKVDPVEESERPWEREGWCNEKGDFWAEGMNREGIAEWKQANRNYLGNWMVRCLPHNAIPLPPPQTGEAAELVPVGELDDQRREAVHRAVVEALGSGAYDCLRVWEAWDVGTMGPDDFVPLAEDSDRVAEIADAAIDAIRAVPLPAPAPVVECPHCGYEGEMASAPQAGGVEA